MTTWFTADLHFGHANIIDYSGRPFADATAMNQALIERWNASIHPDDTVWVLDTPGPQGVKQLVDFL